MPLLTSSTLCRYNTQNNAHTSIHTYVILMHMSIQVVYCQYILISCMEWLWNVKCWHLRLKQEDQWIEQRISCMVQIIMFFSITVSNLDSIHIYQKNWIHVTSASVSYNRKVIGWVGWWIGRQAGRWKFYKDFLKFNSINSNGDLGFNCRNNFYQ